MHKIHNRNKYRREQNNPLNNSLIDTLFVTVQGDYCCADKNKKFAEETRKL